MSLSITAIKKLSISGTKKIGVPLDRIFKKGDKDNFWEMGEFGPCGPCSEIFYDHGEKHATPSFTLKEGGDILDDELRYVEIWNLVFMQYEKTKDGQFSLPRPSIDTGAGLERVAAAMQGVYWKL
jgi:alanyl-tRNA synthetase